MHEAKFKFPMAIGGLSLLWRCLVSISFVFREIFESSCALIRTHIMCLYPFFPETSDVIVILSKRSFIEFGSKN